MLILLCGFLKPILRTLNIECKISPLSHFQALEEEFTVQLEEQERQAASTRIPPPSSTMPQHSSTLHSSRTSLASSHYD